MGSVLYAEKYILGHFTLPYFFFIKYNHFCFYRKIPELPRGREEHNSLLLFPSPNACVEA